jgi:predicted regulator of Ras-like GTPase activity (Roadblock/LC7/MglB family)
VTTESEVLDLLEELSAIQGVKGALIAAADGALADGRHSSLEAMVAADVAKTVRRMVVASATVGAPLEELLINFGAARMLVIPVREEATLVVMMERDTATAPVRSLLDIEIDRLGQLIDGLDEGNATDSMSGAKDEVETLMRGELGPVLRDIEGCYTRHLGRAGVNKVEAAKSMRAQMKEWLLCCNPSSYTFPLLLDGLSQTMNEMPSERSAFVDEVHEILRKSGAWTGRTN